MSKFRVACVSSVVLATLIVCSPTRASDAACKPVFDAMTTMARTPNHQYMTRTAGFQPGVEKSEIITTGNAMYVMVAGSWHRSDYNPQQQAGELRQAYEQQALTCKYLRDEAVDGETAALYDTRQTQDDGTIVHSQLWISRARELPLRQTIDIDVGGKAGKSHTDLRTDYNKVQAPAAAQ